jgi:tetratricopeptide (TPR) repeat protein/small basic protein
MRTGWLVLILLLVIFAVFLVCDRTARAIFGWQVAALPSGELTDGAGWVTTAPAPGERSWGGPVVLEGYYRPGLGLPREQSWRKALKAAIRKHPNDWRLILGAGGAVATAQDFERAYRLAGKSGWPYAYAGVGNIPICLSRLRPKNSRCPAEPPAVEASHLARARRYLEKAIALEPGNAYYDQLLAYVLLAQGRERKGVAALERAVEKPYWSDHFLDWMRCAEHAYLAAGADPVTARILAWRPPSYFQYFYTLKPLAERVSERGAEAARAGDHGRAIHLYRLVIRSGWQVRTGASTLQTILDGASIEATPAVSHFEDAELGIEPVVWRFMPDWQSRSALSQEKFRAYLAGHSEEGLAQFLLAEQVRIRDGLDRLRGYPGYEYDYSHGISALVDWLLRQRLVMVLLLVAAAWLLAVWLPNIILPRGLRQRITDAIDGQGRYALLGHILVSVLPFVAFFLLISLGFGLLSRPAAPDNLISTCCVAAVAGLILYVIGSVQAAWRIYVRKVQPRGFLTQFISAVRFDLLWVTVGLLLAYVVLAVPLNFAAGDVGWHIGRVMGHGETYDIPMHIPAFHLPSPPPPGPEVASVAQR